jgi:transposase-like protein
MQAFYIQRLRLLPFSRRWAKTPRLDPFKEEIQKFLDKDVSMLSISKILEVSYPTLFNFIKKHGMLKASQKAQKKKKNSTKKK